MLPELGQPDPRDSDDPELLPHAYCVDRRKPLLVALQNAYSVTGQPGDQPAPFRSMTPTPSPDDPLVETPLLPPDNWTSAHVPFASDKSRPPS